MVISRDPPSTFQSGSRVRPLRHRTRRSTTVLPPRGPASWRRHRRRASGGDGPGGGSRSWVVSANSDSRTTSSSSTPSCLGHNHTASANIAVPFDHRLEARDRRSGVPKPTESRCRASRSRSSRRTRRTMIESTRAQTAGRDEPEQFGKARVHAPSRRSWRRPSRTPSMMPIAALAENVSGDEGGRGDHVRPRPSRMRTSSSTSGHIGVVRRRSRA